MIDVRLATYLDIERAKVENRVALITLQMEQKKEELDNLEKERWIIKGKLQAFAESTKFMVELAAAIERESKIKSG